jgi:hypothetical protein
MYYDFEYRSKLAWSTQQASFMNFRYGTSLLTVECSIAILDLYYYLR